MRFKYFILPIIIILFLTDCASVITHSLDYPASDELFITSGDDPGTESIRPYIPKGQFIHVSQESYLTFPILGIFIKFGNANPQYVFDTEVIPKIRSMGGDALTNATVNFIPAAPWFMGIIGIRTGAQTTIIGQVVKRPEKDIALQEFGNNPGMALLETKTNISKNLQPLYNNKTNHMNINNKSDLNILGTAHEINTPPTSRNSVVKKPEIDVSLPKISNNQETTLLETRTNISKTPHSLYNDSTNQINNNDQSNFIILDKVHEINTPKTTNASQNSQNSSLTNTINSSSNKCFLAVFIKNKPFFDSSLLSVELDTSKYFIFNENKNQYDIILLKDIKAGVHFVKFNYSDKSQSVPISLQINEIQMIELYFRKALSGKAYLSNVKLSNIHYDLFTWANNFTSKSIYLIACDN
jgi:hypothetical protein